MRQRMTPAPRPSLSFSVQDSLRSGPAGRTQTQTRADTQTRANTDINTKRGTRADLDESDLRSQLFFHHTSLGSAAHKKAPRRAKNNMTKKTDERRAREENMRRTEERSAREELLRKTDHRLEGREKDACGMRETLQRRSRRVEIRVCALQP